MGRTPKYYPSFFKILMGDFATKMLIPGKFASRDLQGNPPAKVLIKHQNGSLCWPVKVKKTGERQNNYSFIGSGWRKFVRECELKEKDFLVFTLIMNSVFEVVRYDPTGCAKGLVSSPSIEIHDGSVADHIKEENPAKACKARSRKSKEPLPHPRTRRSRENMAEASGSGKQEDQDLFFTTVFRKQHHISCLTLARSFARETGMARKSSVILRNGEGKEWSVNLLPRTYPTAGGRIDLGVGWPLFRKENKIADGDSCTFKFCRSDGDMIDVVVQKRGRG